MSPYEVHRQLCPGQNNNNFLTRTLTLALTLLPTDPNPSPHAVVVPLTVFLYRFADFPKL